MIRKYYICFAMLVLMLSVHANAQTTIVSSGGTLNDKFSKKIGNLMFSASTVKFGRIKNNVTKTDTIRILNTGAAAVNISIGKFPAHLKLDLKSSSVAPNSESSIVVSYDALKKNDYGFALDRFELITNDVDQPNKTLSVTATIEEAFAPIAANDTVPPAKARWKETSFDYGNIKAGDKVVHEFVVFNDGKKDLLIHKVKTNCGCLKATVSKSFVSPGDSSIVKVNFDSVGKEGKDSRKLNVYLNDYLKSDVIIEMKGEVTK